MLGGKHTTGIIIAITSIAVLICLLAVAFSDKITGLLGGNGVTQAYESKLFDTDEIITIDIQMDEEDWETMLQNAMSEEYYTCDVVINGETIKNVAIRPKGNTSLSSIASNPDTDRYSLKLEFDHYVKGQTCFGLDKLILNNNYADATNMKEAIGYDMFEFLDADASLYNYASVSVNGEYIGVYLALEAVEQSFMLRNYGTQDGELYKPDSMEIGGDNNSFPSPSSSSPAPSMPDDSSDFQFSPSDKEGMTPPSGGGDPFADGEDSDKEDSFQKGFGGGMGGLSMGGGGADLSYNGDDLDNYSTIWDGAITNTTEKDHKRVVTALKNISEGTDIEEYLDVDNVLKYMAVHTFAVNMDSLSGTMAHNYYIYEYDGQLNIIPWDYNLSWGGMGMGNSSNAEEMINDAIDTPFSSTDFFDVLLENEEYLAKYHEYLNMLVEEYVESGRFEAVYNRIRSQIDSLVKTDPTAFYNYDEYEAAAEMLYKTILLRAESIKGQLDGTIPSTDDGQREDSSAFVDASGIDVSVMGRMNMGGGGFGGGDSDISFFKRDKKGGDRPFRRPGED
ncbi:MAG: CotH kinase family protein [Lachnospiraceae bacterium]|nr:CotH kinase family protein [Lachnospiraceae bacterium]